MTFPTLYKRTQTGAIQQWTITAESEGANRGTINTTYGQVGGAMQSTQDVVTEGKSPGKKNATTPAQQAEREAEARWTKALKKGYVQDIEVARAGGRDKIIEGGIDPMLAQSYSKHASKIVFPAYAQRKYDGIRCIAMIVEGQCSLWTRTRKRITSMPHIEVALEERFRTGTVILDGELYNHNYKHNFEKIVSLVRQDVPAEDHGVVEYHVYDEIMPGPFRTRTQILAQGLHGIDTCVVRVESLLVHDEEGLMEAFAQFTSEGYEGLMVRNSASEYENKRSMGLQKVKEMTDSDHVIVGFEEGRGKLQGHVAAFVCALADGRTFKAKPMGELAVLKKYFEDHSLWTGKHLVVKYQNLTTDGMPRFPIGVRLRDSADY